LSLWRGVAGGSKKLHTGLRGINDFAYGKQDRVVKTDIEEYAIGNGGGKNKIDQCRSLRECEN